MRFTEILEYVDPEEAKREILDRVSQIDPSDESNQKLLDRIYTIVDKTGVTDRLMPTLNSSLKQEYNEKATKIIAEKIVSSDRITLKEKQKFLDNLQKDKCVKADFFTKSGHYSLSDLFYGQNENYQMFLEFLSFGLGQQRAGKGEHSLSILSQKIQQKGLGDITVDGTPVELKVAERKGSGRLGEGGVSAERMKNIIGGFEELTDALNNYSKGGVQTDDEFIKSKGKPDKPQKSINVRDFVRVVNSLGLDQNRRAEIGKAIFEDRFGNYGDQITKVFSQPGAAPRAVLEAYIEANFEWYKASTGGGNWQFLSSIGIGTGSMITVESGKELVNLFNNDVLSSNLPAIIPTQEPEIYFQINPRAKS
jgi:hypothetical protein